MRQRQGRRRQTDVWEEAVRAIGTPPDGVRWVHMGDRGSDIYRFLATCQAQHCDFLVRPAKNRCVTEDTAREADSVIAYLFPVVRAWKGKEERTIRVLARHGTPARTATVQLT